MFIPAVIGRIHVPAEFMFPAAGTMVRVVTGGIEAIGDNFDMRIGRCADFKT